MESFSQLVYSTMEFGDVVQVSHFLFIVVGSWDDHFFIFITNNIIIITSPTSTWHDRPQWTNRFRTSSTCILICQANVQHIFAQVCPRKIVITYLHTHMLVLKMIPTKMGVTPRYKLLLNWLHCLHFVYPLTCLNSFTAKRLLCLLHTRWLCGFMGFRAKPQCHS